MLGSKAPVHISCSNLSILCPFLCRNPLLPFSFLISSFSSMRKKLVFFFLHYLFLRFSNPPLTFMLILNACMRNIKCWLKHIANDLVKGSLPSFDKNSPLFFQIWKYMFQSTKKRFNAVIQRGCFQQHRCLNARFHESICGFQELLENHAVIPLFFHLTILFIESYSISIFSC